MIYTNLGSCEMSTSVTENCIECYFTATVHQEKKIIFFAAAADFQVKDNYFFLGVLQSKEKSSPRIKE